jgi:molybdopterin synthase catalytic subunit
LGTQGRSASHLAPRAHGSEQCRPMDVAPLTATMRTMHAPPHGDTWVGLTAAPLPIADAYEWAVRADCGAVVLFSGTVRNHAEGRDGVQHLTYEAYDELAPVKMSEIADEVRVRWPRTGRVVLLHRTGRLEIGDSSVIVVVSSPHRPEAFEAGRYAIDALKASVPIWKHEVWDTGSDWGTGAHDVVSAQAVVSEMSVEPVLSNGEGAE